MNNISKLPTAFEWHNLSTGHSYVDYIPHLNKDEKDGYTKTPLFELDEIDINTPFFGNTGAKIPNIETINKDSYPVIAIDDIDAETVKRWYQELVGNHDDSIMKKDIQAMARASDLNKHLKWN